MKIAQVVCVLPPYGGGIGKVAHYYAHHLRKLGHEVAVFTPQIIKRSEAGASYKIKFLWPIFKFGLGSIMPQLVWRLWTYDVIHLHYPFFGSSFFVALLKAVKGGKIKLVVSYHMDVRFERIWALFYKIYSHTVLPFILNQADKIVVSSEDYIENSDIQSYYFQHIEKFVELPFGARKSCVPREKDAELLAQYAFSADDKIILFVGGLDSAHYFKGVNYLIRAISLISDGKIKALIVGDGNLKKQYEHLVQKLNLENRIKFSGFVPDGALCKHFNLCDIFILPSINKSEAFGIVLLEAMACAKPLIASNLKGVRSVVLPGINGFLVEPQNSQDIANKIVYLAQNQYIANLFGKAGRKLVEEKYRWPIIVKKLENVYESLHN